MNTAGNTSRIESPQGRSRALWRRALALAALLVVAAGVALPVRGEADKLAAIPPGAQIVLHRDLKTCGTLATISYNDAIRSCMGNVEGYPVADKRMIRTFFHPFVQMVHMGFAAHRPVSISPDAVWLMICNGFAVHAEVSGDGLQRKLFPKRGDGKVRIEVRLDNFQKGVNNGWESCFGELTRKMDVVLASDLKETLTNPFSTTGPAEKAAFEITFMKTMERSFEGYGATLCGIPSITLEGTPADWENLAARAEKLRGYDCDWWLDALKPVLAQFAAAAKGKVDRDFWCSIYKVDEESGGPYITGWCVLFFPYFERREADESMHWEKNRYLMNQREREEFVAKFVRQAEERARESGETIDAKKLTELFLARMPQVAQLLAPAEAGKQGGTKIKPFRFTTDSFRNSIATVPFVWNYYDKKFDMQFLAGFCGVSYDPKSELLRAEIAWGVKDPQAPALDEPDYKRLDEENAQNLSPDETPTK